MSDPHAQNDLDLNAVPALTLHQTLRPTGIQTKLWSSAPHPSETSPLLATASSDKNVHIWDMRSWQLVSTVSGGHKRSIRCVDWKDYGPRKKQRLDNDSPVRPPNVLLATGSFDANCGLWLWNRDAKRRRQEILEMNGLASDTLSEASRKVPGAFESDTIEQDFTDHGLGREDGAGEEDEEEEWQYTTCLTGPDSEIKGLVFSPAHYGSNWLATCSRDKSVWIWEEVEEDEWETAAVLGEHQGDVKAVTWLDGVHTSRREIRRRLNRRGMSGQDHISAVPDLLTSTDTNMSINLSPDEEDSLILGHRELLASSSYDSTIRLYHFDDSDGDWTCISVLLGHEGTVWSCSFESHLNLSSYPPSTIVDEIVVDWQPRLISCSDDMTIRVWRKELNNREKEQRREGLLAARTNTHRGSNVGDFPRSAPMGFSSTQIPSTMRGSTEEKWIEEGMLPRVHLRSIYAVDWSARTGLVVSCGGDGLIAVYKEVSAAATAATTGSPSIMDTIVPAQPTGEDTVMNGTGDHDTANEREVDLKTVHTTWQIVAMVEDAHDEFEINHVCWAPRRDDRRDEIAAQDGTRFEQGHDDEEEYIVSTGDDGDVRVWKLPEDVLTAVRLDTY